MSEASDRLVQVQASLERARRQITDLQVANTRLLEDRREADGMVRGMLMQINSLEGADDDGNVSYDVFDGWCRRAESYLKRSKHSNEGGGHA